MADIPSTTLSSPLTGAADGAGFGRVQVASIADVHKGDWLVVDYEAMPVLDHTVNPVRVMRGGASTSVAAHQYGATVYVASPDRFKTTDPTGTPDRFPTANPWINLRARRTWFAQGDEVGPGAALRYWQLQVIGPRVVGALGVLQSPPSTP